MSSITYLYNIVYSILESKEAITLPLFALVVDMTALVENYKNPTYK